MIGGVVRRRRDLGATAPPTAQAPGGVTDYRATLEHAIVRAVPWHPGRKYLAGWSDERDVVLMYRDGDGERRTERVTDVPWYFFMRTDDALKVPVELWASWRRWGCFERLEIDPVSPDWTRVHAVRKVSQTRWLRDRGEVGVGINILDDPRSRKLGGKDTEAGAGGKKDRDEAWKISADMRQKGMDEARRAMYASGEYTRIDTDWDSRGSLSVAGSSQHELRKQVTSGSEERKAAAVADRKANWQKYEAEVKLHDFLIELHRYGPTFEADLTPKQRFMTDRYVEVEDRYHELFFDIETDDSVPGWENKETWRHLSYAAVLRDRDGREERMSLVIGKEDDAHERAMLREVKTWVDRADVLYAWNGFNFDFPILRARFRLYGIDYDWRNVIWCDLLAVWRRYHYRGASAITSFALGDLGPAVLHREKLDWREESARRGDRVDRIVDLYRRHPDLLREYNERDAELLYGLEREFGYAATEQLFCRAGNCFANDYHVSTKVDMLLLNRGAVSGKHFFTRGLQFDFLPAYIVEQQRSSVRLLGESGEVETEGRKSKDAEYAGAYVFPPVVGYHEGVAALDFKSLYPSVMTLWNISPETWVSRDDVPPALRDRPALADLEAAGLSVTPSGAFFRRDDGDGMVPLVFRETLEKRKVYQRLQIAEKIGSEKFLLYYRLAYAFKRLGLSMYGEIGNETSRYFNPEVAEAVTLGGQWLIKKTAEFAERSGYRVLAGDTDSIYLKMTEAQAEAFVRDCDGFYREIVRPFNVDLGRFLVELEYENYFDSIVFVKKKRYAGIMRIFKGNEEPNGYLEIKGLESMRSDGLGYAREMQKRALDLVLRRRRPPVADAVAFVEAERERVFSGSLSVDEVSMTQAIEKSVDEYKSKPPHVRIAERIRAVSAEYFVGMKVPYVMIPATPDPLKPGRRLAPVPVWTREYAEGTYDRHHAWNAKVYPPTLRVLEAVYPEHDWLAYHVEPPRPEPAPRASARRAARKPAKSKASSVVRKKIVSP